MLNVCTDFMKYHFKANARLHAYISRYWVWDNQAELPAMLPGTGAELIFHLHSDRLQSLSHMLLPRKTPFRFAITDQHASFIAVRFRHNALRHFCNCPISEMIDTHVTAADIWGKAGQEIENRIIETQTIEEKIELLNHFLLIQLAMHNKTQHAWLDGSLSQLYERQSRYSLDTVIQQTEISTRYFQKIFKHNTGVSPKYFQRTARFEHVLRTLLLTKNRHYLDVALAYGYYDQAHFIKEFKQFTQCTPLEFLQEKNFRTHFYNPPLLT